MTPDEWRAAIFTAVNDALDARARNSAAKVEHLIPRKRTAKLLGKDVSTLYRWERSGYLVPAVRRGRSILYSSKDLERLGVILD